MNEPSPETTLSDMEINNPEFYNNVQDEIDNDLARLKKNISLISKLRLTAAEMEVETAALYLAEIWFEIEDIKNNTTENSNANEVASITGTLT